MQGRPMLKIDNPRLRSRRTWTSAASVLGLVALSACWLWLPQVRPFLMSAGQVAVGAASGGLLIWGAQELVEYRRRRRMQVKIASLMWGEIGYFRALISASSLVSGEVLSKALEHSVWHEMRSQVAEYLDADDIQDLSLAYSKIRTACLGDKGFSLQREDQAEADDRMRRVAARLAERHLTAFGTAPVEQKRMEPTK